MGVAPKIYEVMQFRELRDNRFELRVHYVAALSSASAVAQLQARQTYRDLLTGSLCYVNTDEWVNRYDDGAIKCNVTAWNKSEPLTRSEFMAWRHAHCKAFREGGETFPPAYRPFQVAN